jgi:hypothetical protein
MHYEQAQLRVRKAQAAVSLPDFYAQLHIAAHHFLSAFMIAHDLEERHAGDPPEIDYRAHIADEGFAGLCNAICAVDDDDPLGAFEQRVLATIRAEGLEAAEELTEHLTGITDMKVPRPIGQLCLARALATAGGPFAPEAIKRLEALEPRFLDAGGLEYELLLGALIVAARNAGDEQAGRRYATRLAARLILQGGP